jgi:hypothetical protein
MAVISPSIWITRFLFTRFESRIYRRTVHETSASTRRFSLFSKRNNTRTFIIVCSFFVYLYSLSLSLSLFQ